MYLTSGTGVASAVRRSDGKVLWRNVLTSGVQLWPPVLIGGMLIVVGSFGTCFGLSSASGKTKWQKPVEEAADLVVPVTKRAFAVSEYTNGDRCVVMDARSGRRLSEWENFAPSDDPKPKSQNRLIWPVVAQSGLVYLAWSDHVAQQRTGSDSFDFDGWVSEVSPLSPPTLGAGRLLVGTSGGISAFDAGTGGDLWSAATDGPVTAAPTVTDRTVYAGSSDGRLYAFDLRTGKRKWTVAADAPITASPIVGHGAAHVVTSAGMLFTMLNAD
jgi:outer membrane protein assembly factor BamB